MVVTGASGQARALWRRAAVVGLVGVMLTAALAVWYVMFPKIDSPRRVDAIFMLEGAGDRRGEAFELVRSGIAPVLVVSIPGRKRCPTVADVGRDVDIICFRPDPSTTRGEAREAGRLARLHGWRSMLFVTDRSQNNRARLRIERCYHGKILVASTGTPRWQWPYLLAYQSTAALKALLWQRGC
jgi:hypothetical protein